METQLESIQKRFQKPFHIQQCFGVLIILVLFLSPFIGSGQVLIEYNKNWKYALEGTTPASDWKTLGFNDSGWKGTSPPAPAPFGFGSIHTPGTVLISRPNPVAPAGPTNKNYPVYYFRKKFNITDKGAISGLSLTVKYDDAVEVFLNNQKVAEQNMGMNPTPGEEAYFGSPPVGTMPDILQKNLETSALVNGENIIAVALHQGGSQSSDVFFDLKLEAASVTNTVLVRYPYLQLPSYNRMSVWWTTNQPSNSTVRYSTNANMSGFVEVVDANVNTLHKVNLLGLQPNTKYYYLVGYGTGNNFIPLQNNTAATNFHTLPPPTDKSATMRFWLLGDAGAGKETNQRPINVRNAYLAYLQSKGNPKVDAMLFLGDNSNGEGVEGEQAALDKTIFKFYNQPADKQLLSRIPSWTVMGNHDYNPDPNYVHKDGRAVKIRKSYHTQIAASFTSFAFPENGEIGGERTGNKKGYYSFDQGDVHFVVLNPYSFEDDTKEHRDIELSVNPDFYEIYSKKSISWNKFHPDESIDNLPQVQWLRKDLMNNTKKWTVVTFHQPPFTTMGHFEEEFDLERIRTKLLPILEEPQYRVDMIAVSHSHAYLRGGMVRIINGERTTDFARTGNLGRSNNPYIKSDNKTAYSYLLTGSAGRGALNDGDVVSNRDKPPKPPGDSELPLDNIDNKPTSFYHELGGSVELLFKENRLDVTFIRENGTSFSVDDQYVIIKNDCNIAVPSLSANPSSVPSGGSSTLTANGCAGTVKWNHDQSTGTSKVVTPTSTTTYTATCTVNNCTSSNGSVTVTVIPPPCTPTLFPLGDQCSGNPNEIRTYNINLPAGSPFPVELTYRSHEKAGIVRIRINDGSWQSVNVGKTPADLSYGKVSLGSRTFNSGNNKVELASGDGYICFRQLSVCITTPPCDFAVSTDPATINTSPNASIPLNALCTGSGCAGVSYEWIGPGGSCSTQSCTINVPGTPGTHIYTVTARKNGCDPKTARVTVNVDCNVAPTLSANPSTINAGQSSTLSASGCAGTVAWSHGLSFGTPQVVRPTSTTTYTATCTVGNCTSSNGSVTVTVIPGPCTSFPLGDQCSGNQAEIRTYNVNLPSGGIFPVELTYRSHEKAGVVRIRINGGIWQSVNVGKTPADLSYEKVSLGSPPFNSGNNKVELASGDGYICFRELCLKAEGCIPPAPPTLSANPSTITFGGSSTLSASGCTSTVTWSHGLGTGNSKVVSPNNTTTYTATCTNSVNNCTSGSSSVTVTVGDTPPQCIALNDQCSGNSQEIRTYNFSSSSGGSKNLMLTYRSHERTTTGRIRINVGAWQTFNLSQTSLNYATTSIGSYSFLSGNNTVELASGGGYVCFREMCVGNIGTRIGVAEEALSDSPELTVSPNPNNGEFEARFYVEPGRRAVLLVNDMQGREIWQKNLKGIGEQHETVQLPTTAAGPFILLLRKEATAATSKVEYKKVIVVK